MRYGNFEVSQQGTYDRFTAPYGKLCATRSTKKHPFNTLELSALRTLWYLDFFGKGFFKQPLDVPD